MKTLNRKDEKKRTEGRSSNRKHPLSTGYCRSRKMNIFREIAIFGIVRGLVRKAFLALVAAALLCVERGSAFIPPRGPE